MRENERGGVDAGAFGVKDNADSRGKLGRVEGVLGDDFEGWQAYYLGAVGQSQRAGGCDTDAKTGKAAWASGNEDEADFRWGDAMILAQLIDGRQEFDRVNSRLGKPSDAEDL